MEKEAGSVTWEKTQGGNYHATSAIVTKLREMSFHKSSRFALLIMEAPAKTK